MAIVQFRSSTPYRLATIHPQPVTPGEAVYSAGFPMYTQDHLTTTFDRGIQRFRLTQGVVSLLLPKSLDQGYRLGYTNDISVGMSGGPIFNQQRLLVGINGRVKNRDPDFGVYTFDDGTSPHPEILDQMIHSSWGIPITTYVQLRNF
ncbi:trypsin-like peptidase domain-containing protein [Nostoc sp. FACHB-973]|nr:trypsin-like peptidase domain-containing protein [Nostoc sp. FACHB-973]